MPDRLEIVVTLKDIASRGFSKISSAARRFASAVGSAVKGAGRSLLDFAKNVFFVTAAMDALGRAGRALFDLFIQGAGSAAKMEVKLKSVTGSAAEATRIMEFLRQTAQQTGADFDSLSRGATLMAVAAKDAGGAFDFDKFVRLSNILQAMSAFSPQVPLERLARGLSTAVTTGDWSSLEMFLDINLRQLLGITAAAEDVVKVPGEIGKAATFIELEVADAAQAATGNLDQLEEALARAGIGFEMVQDMAELSGIERFNETLQAIARMLGKPLFEALNESAAELAEWLQENPELIDEFATALGKLGAAGIEKVFEAVTNMLASTDWEKFFGDATKFLELLTAGDIEGAFEVVGLGDLGDDLKDAVGSLGDIAEALATVAEWILKIAESKGPEIIGAVGKAAGIVAPGGAGFEEVQRAGWAGASADLERLVRAQVTPQELGMALVAALVKEIKPQKVDVAVTLNLDNDMLQAQVRQGAEETVVRAFDEVHQNYRNRER